MKGTVIGSGEGRMEGKGMDIGLAVKEVKGDIRRDSSHTQRPDNKEVY